MASVWNVLAADPPRAARLASALGVDPITGQLLLNRGIGDRAHAERFLQPRLDALEDPTRLPDMARAVARLRRAIAKQEPILLFSDSDTDGLTASVILYEALKARGALVRARISNRIADGYGLPMGLVRQLARSSTKLLILVDCGTNQPDEIRALAEAGIDTIIVDHHVPLDGWAKAHALINPHRDSQQGPGRELCSAGLALKVVQALGEGASVESLRPFLDLAALGTLADCAPLIGDNRAIVAEGMTRILETPRPGLRRLCEATGLSRPEPEQILRRLTPRINASGRLGDATAVWRLLLNDDEGGVEAWMAATEEAHARTKQLHRRIAAEAHEQVNRLHFKDQVVIVVSGTGWHQGLMGPLASQLAEQYGRPAIAIAMEEHRGIGSGRSSGLFNLLQAVQACQSLLVRFGGHGQACGLTVSRRNLEPFRALVNQHARRSLGAEGLVRTTMADVELPLEAIQPRWVSEAARFSPFGQGNPSPRVLIRHVAIEPRSPRCAVVSDGRHRVAGRGGFAGLVREARYDVMANPALVDGELELMVSDVRGSTAPWRLGPT